MLSNKEVVDIVASAPAQSSAARFLVESAVRAWRLKYPTSKIDDCAVVCLFLNTDAPNNSANLKTKVTGSAGSMGTDKGKQEPSTPSGVDHYEILPGKGEEGTKKQLYGSQSCQEPADGNATVMEGDEWSTLECVSRVDTLLTLPRFVAGVRPPASTKTQK